MEFKTLLKSSYCPCLFLVCPPPHLCKLKNSDLAVSQAALVALSLSPGHITRHPNYCSTHQPFWYTILIYMHKCYLFFVVLKLPQMDLGYILQLYYSLPLKLHFSDWENSLQQTVVGLLSLGVIEQNIPFSVDGWKLFSISTVEETVSEYSFLNQRSLNFNLSSWCHFGGFCGRDTVMTVPIKRISKHITVWEHVNWSDHCSKVCWYFSKLNPDNVLLTFKKPDISFLRWGENIFSSYLSWMKEGNGLLSPIWSVNTDSYWGDELPFFK